MAPMWLSMRTAISLLLFISPSVHALLPAPKRWQHGSDALLLSKNFHFNLDRSSFTEKFPPPDDLVTNVELSQWYIDKQRFERLVVGRGEADRALLKDASELTSIDLFIPPSHDGSTRILPVAQEAVKLPEDQDESYLLQIQAGSSRLTANTTLGLLRGLQTFVQLIYALPSDERYILNTPLQIFDEPSFGYRGFMLDTARNFFRVPYILRTLDAMSWAKLNVFHWHITDSQSWPLEVPEFPELAQKGSYSAAEVYSTQDIEYVQYYAATRGISILLEIDMPGHTASIAEAYPEHLVCVNKQPWTPWANEPPSGQLKLMDKDVQHFVEGLYRSVASRSAGPYFSHGGDEINAKCYESDPKTNSSLVRAGLSIDDGISQLVQGAQKSIMESGKTPVAWEEMILDHKIKLHPSTIVMAWVSSESVKHVVDTGYRIVHAASDFFYLDCGGGGWVAGTIGNSWCDPFKTWQKIYSFDPYANVTDSQRHLVLGGETLLWTEQADNSNMEAIVWPRAAAAAEVFWTGASQTNGSARSALEALPRLHEWRSIAAFLPGDVLAICLSLSCPEGNTYGLRGKPNPLRVACLVSRHWRSVAETVLWTHLCLDRTQCYKVLHELENTRRQLPVTRKVTINGAGVHGYHNGTFWATVRQLLALRPGLRMLCLAQMSIPGLAAFDIPALGELQNLRMLYIGFPQGELTKATYPNLPFKLSTLYVEDGFESSLGRLLHLPMKSSVNLELHYESEENGNDPDGDATVLSKKLSALAPKLQSLMLNNSSWSGPDYYRDHSFDEDDEDSIYIHGCLYADLHEAHRLERLEASWWDVLGLIKDIKSPSLRRLNISGCESLCLFNPLLPLALRDLRTILHHDAVQGLMLLRFVGWEVEPADLPPELGRIIRRFEERGVKVVYGEDPDLSIKEFRV